MQTLKDKALTDNNIMSIAKVEEIRHIIAHTNKGDLCLTLQKGGIELDYKFILDAVPFNEEDNKALIEIFNGVLYTL